jgi:cytochrome c biogenesis factor
VTATIGSIAIVAAAAGCVVALSGRTRAARAGLVASTTALVVAVVAMAWALLTNDYSIAYVTESSRRAASGAYRLAGLWGGMAGSLLLWTAMLSCWSLGAFVRAAGWTTRPQGGARVLAAAQLVFLLPLLTVTRPFVLAGRPPDDGSGLHPLLEHAAMLYHPPLLYLGLTALVTPLAIAVAVFTADARPDAPSALRTSTWRAVLLLGAGLLTGAHWAYQEQGWGGFWAWDPIENSALIPWLLAVAAVHARRSSASALLVVVAAVSAGAGAFLTRSGSTVSQHAFAEARSVGWLLLGGLVVGGAALAAAVLRGRHDPTRGLLTAPTVLLGGAAVVVGLGTFVPAVMMTAGSSPRVVEASYFVGFAGPLLAVASLWCAREAVRRAVPAAARVAHAGVVVLAVGVVASTTGWSATVSLEQGTATTAHGHDVVLVDVVPVDRAGRRELVAVVRVDGSVFRPGLRETGSGDVTAESVIRSAPAGDLMIVPRRIDPDGHAIVDVHRKPFVAWVWVGGAMALVGIAITMSRRRRLPSTRGRAAGGDQATPPAQDPALSPGLDPALNPAWNPAPASASAWVPASPRSGAGEVVATPAVGPSDA